VSESPRVAGCLNDVRRRGSPSLSWYFQARLRWSPEISALRPLSIVALVPWDYYVFSPYPSVRVPLDRQSFIWSTGQFFAAGRLISAHLHGGSLIEEALLFFAQPEELGLFEESRKEDRGVPVPTHPEQMGVAGNSEVKRHILSHLRSSSKRKSNGGIACQFQGRLEVVDGIELPRKASALCSAAAFVEATVWTVVFFFNGKGRRSRVVGDLENLHGIAHLSQHVEVYLSFESANSATLGFGQYVLGARHASQAVKVSMAMVATRHRTHSNGSAARENTM